MSKPFTPALDPETVQRITEAVKYIEVPADALLLKSTDGMQRQVDVQRMHLQQALEQNHADGLAAAARILLSPDDLKARPGSDYFTRS